MFALTGVCKGKDLHRSNGRRMLRTQHAAVGFQNLAMELLGLDIFAFVAVNGWRD